MFEKRIIVGKVPPPCFQLLSVRSGVGEGWAFNSDNTRIRWCTIIITWQWHVLAPYFLSTKRVLAPRWLLTGPLGRQTIAHYVYTFAWASFHFTLHSRHRDMGTGILCCFSVTFENRFTSREPEKSCTEEPA